MKCDYRIIFLLLYFLNIPSLFLILTFSLLLPNSCLSPFPYFLSFLSLSFLLPPFLFSGPFHFLYSPLPRAWEAGTWQLPVAIFIISVTIVIVSSRLGCRVPRKGEGGDERERRGARENKREAGKDLIADVERAAARRHVNAGCGSHLTSRKNKLYEKRMKNRKSFNNWYRQTTCEKDLQTHIKQTIEAAHTVQLNLRTHNENP